MLICLDRKDGQVRWQREVAFSPLEPRHKLNSYSSSTPATDGKHVFVSFLRLRKKADNDDQPARRGLPPGTAAWCCNSIQPAVPIRGTTSNWLLARSDAGGK